MAKTVIASLAVLVVEVVVKYLVLDEGCVGVGAVQSKWLGCSAIQ